jgi:flavorubredoxin
MEKAYHATDGISVLPSYFPVPALGFIPVNAFLIEAKAPVLVDAGLHADSDAFLDALRSVIDPRQLRWIWLTHTDQDHVGSLRRLLDEAPRAKVVTSFLGAGKLALVAPLPPERMHFLNPGQCIDLGDRTLTAVKPPVYDAPETTGLYDSKSGAFFSSDCFGAVVAGPVQDAADIPADELTQRQSLWATIDAPWLQHATESWFAAALDGVRRLSPKAILSSHLPPAVGMTERVLSALAAARRAPPFVGPDQAAFEHMLAEAA